MNLYKANIRVLLVLVIVCLLASFGPTSAASPARQTGTPTLVLTHNQYIDNAEWSPDGRWIVTYTDYNTVHLWDAQSGVLAVSLPHNSSDLPKWSPNSTRLVTWQDEKAWVWEVGTWGALAELSHIYPIYNVFWRPDSAGVAILISAINERVDAPGEYHLWDVQTGSEIRVLNTLHNSFLSRFTWSHDAHYAASSEGGAVPLQVWDLTDGREVMELRQPGTLMLFAARLTATWSHTDNYLLISAVRGGAVVMDVPSRSALFTVRDDMLLSNVLWNRDQSLLVGLAVGSRQFTIWDGHTGQLVRELRTDWMVLDVTWTKDGQYLLTLLTDGNLSSRFAVWEAATGAIVYSTDFTGGIYAPEWSPTGNFALTDIYSFDSVYATRQVFSLITGEVALSFGGELAAWHPTEDRLLIVANADSSCTADCTYEVQVWDVQ